MLAAARRVFTPRVPLCSAELASHKARAPAGAPLLGGAGAGAGFEDEISLRALWGWLRRLRRVSHSGGGVSVSRLPRRRHI